MKTEPKPDVSPHSKYFIYIAILFVVVLMISNTVGIKIIQIGSLPLAGGIFIFPISYIFGDILTEVYGYKASRKIIWSGFFSIIFMAFCYWLTKVLPPAPFLAKSRSLQCNLRRSSENCISFNHSIFLGRI